MKTAWFLILFGISGLAGAQVKNRSCVETDARVKLIRKQLNYFKAVEKLNNNEGSSIYYYNNNELGFVSVIQKAQIEKRVQWFFDNGSLIYSETIWIETSTEKIIKHDQQYLSQGHLLTWIDTDNRNCDTASPEFVFLDRALNEYAALLLCRAAE